MSQFQEYPKKMHHPQHVPAVWKQLEGKGKGLFAPDTVCTQVERYPEVTVTTLEQEKQYAARGYRPNNMPDPAGYEQAILEAQPVAGGTFQAYPKWKYHPLEVPVIVQSALEEQALGAEWKDAPIIATEEDLEVAASAAPAGGQSMAEYAASREETPAAAKPKAKPKKQAKGGKGAHHAHKAAAAA